MKVEFIHSKTYDNILTKRENPENIRKINFQERIEEIKKEWEKQIARVGFKIEESREIISPTITRLFDVFLITALPSQVLKKAFGRRVIFRPRFVLIFLTRIFIKYVEEEEDEGSNLFIVARKPKR